VTIIHHSHIKKAFLYFKIAHIISEHGNDVYQNMSGQQREMAPCTCWKTIEISGKGN
jgi:hypothetical protein